MVLKQAKKFSNSVLTTGLVRYKATEQAVFDEFNERQLVLAKG